MLVDDQHNDFFRHDLDDDPYLDHGQTHDQMTDVHTYAHIKYWLVQWFQNKLAVHVNHTRQQNATLNLNHMKCRLQDKTHTLFRKMEWVTKGWNKVYWHTKRVNFDNEYLQQTERSS